MGIGSRINDSETAEQDDYDEKAEEGYGDDSHHNHDDDDDDDDDGGPGVW